MNQHVEKAAEYVQRGDEFYAKAAAEIVAAHDEGVPYTEIAEGVGRGDDWCRLLADSWRNSDEEGRRNFRVDWRRGSHGTTADHEARIEKALRDPERAQEVIAANPEVVGKVLAEERGFADKALANPRARMRASAATSRHEQAAREQVRSEERARESQELTQEQRDGAILMRLAAASYEIVLAAAQFGRTWNREIEDLSDEGRELALDTLARHQAQIVQVFDAARGADLDAVLAEILAAGE